jgi:biopolymer transport protein ExbD
MGRFRESAAEDTAEAGIDISPLMDCVFILLIFFIVTTTFVEESGIEVDKPSAGGASRQETNTVMIAITQAGEVLHDGQAVGMGGIQTIVRDALRIEDVPVVIQADAGVPAGLLVRVVDEVKLGGADKISVGTRRGGG